MVARKDGYPSLTVGSVPIEGSYGESYSSENGWSSRSGTFRSNMTVKVEVPPQTKITIHTVREERTVKMPYAATYKYDGHKDWL